MTPLRSSLIVLSLISLALPSCSRSQPDRKVVARVNNVPVLASEIKAELALHEQQHPGAKITDQVVDDHLKSLIDRKLMIQAAIAAGISNDRQFAETIKRFWEQTLIRELIKAKNKEWDNQPVSESDLKQAYDRMQYEVLVQAVRVKDKADAVEIERKMRNETVVPATEALGPFFFDDVRLTPLADAFDLAEGGVGLYPAEDGFIVLRMARKRSIACPPLESMQARLTQDVKEYKRERAMTRWMDSLRSTAKISREKTRLEDVKP